MENAALIANRFTKEHPGQRHTKKGPYLLPLIKKFLNKKISYEDPETQKTIRGKVKDAVIWRLILNATQGETHAIKELLDRVDGKTIQVIETPNIPATQLFITNIFQKAGIDDAKRETAQGDR